MYTDVGKYTGTFQESLPPKIFARIDIHCEIQAVPFAQLSQMQPGEPSAAIRERVIAARKIQEERFKPFKGIHSNAMMTEKMLHQFAEPDEQSLDMLSGLCGWAFFDTNAADAVVTRFGSGCSSVVSMTIVENARQGQRCFMGLLDPSVRPYVGTNELSFTIPMSRFKSMMETMKECFLFDSHAWKKVKARLEE